MNRVESADRAASSKPNSKFEEVKTFQHAEGPLIVITKKAGERKHSFAIMKTYDAGKRTSFLNRRHFSAIRELLDQAEEWLDQESERAASQSVISR